MTGTSRQRGVLFFSCTDFFFCCCELLEQTTTGQDKLRAGLPAGIRLGHKTGHTDRTAEGIRIAENDAGYVRLPDGGTCCIVVFVAESRENDAVNTALAAEISAAAYACFTEPK